MISARRCCSLWPLHNQLTALKKGVHGPPRRNISYSLNGFEAERIHVLFTDARSSQNIMYPSRL